MRIPHARLILMCFFSSVRCNHPSAADDPEVLSNLRFAPGAFDSFTRNTELKFTLRHPVTLDITIESRAVPQSSMSQNGVPVGGVPESSPPQTGAPGKHARLGGAAQGGAGGGEFVVKTLIQNASESKGSHSVAWLGDTDGEVFAPAGVYLGVVKINDRRFETTVQVFHF